MVALMAQNARSLLEVIRNPAIRMYLAVARSKIDSYKSSKLSTTRIGIPD